MLFEDIDAIDWMDVENFVKQQATDIGLVLSEQQLEDLADNVYDEMKAARVIVKFNGQR